MKNFRLLSFFFLIFSSSLLWAKPYELVSEHSRIAFDIDYMSMTSVEGKFKSYRGFFNLSEKSDELSSVKVIIDGASVDTNDDKRDVHVKGH